MPSRLVHTLTHCTRRVGRYIKNLLRPVRAASALAGASCVDAVRPRAALLAENALLRQQVLVLRRAASGRRPRLYVEDRLFLVLLARLNKAWRQALLVVKPDTLLRWHRDLFVLVWRRRSQRKGGRRPLCMETIELIRTMAAANRLWGAERIRGELLKLGLRVSKRTIQKYMRSVCPRHPWADLDNLSSESRGGYLGLQLPATFRHLVPATLRVLHRGPREPRDPPCQRHRHSDRCVGGPTAPRGHAVRAGPAVLNPRQRRQVRQSLCCSRRRCRYRGGRHSAEVAEPECHLRTIPRRSPPRMPGPCLDPGRGTSASCIGRMGRAFQRRPTAPGTPSADPERDATPM